jgi:uncharacterized protein involved in exopolysaccharide biosynthesis
MADGALGNAGHPLPVAGNPVPAADPAAETKAVLRDLLLHGWQHRRIVLAAMLVPLVLALLGALLARTEYTASASVIVLLGRENATAQDIAGLNTVNLSVNGLQQAQSEIDVIQSDDVIEDALSTIGIDTLYPLSDHRRWFGLLASAPPLPPELRLAQATALFRAALRASVQENSNILQVTFTYPDRARAITTLEALLEAYLARRRDLFAIETSSFLTAELNQDNASLAAIEQRIGSLERDSGIVDIKQDMQAAANQRDTIERLRAELRERLGAVQAEKVEIAAELARQPRDVLAARDSTNQPGNDDNRNALLKLQIERAHVAAQYAPDDPALRELDSKIALTRAAIGEATRSGVVTTREVRNPALDTLGARLSADAIEAEAIGGQLRALDGEYARVTARIETLRGTDATLQDLERQRELLDSNSKQFGLRAAAARLDEVAAHQRRDNVRIVQHADAPVGGHSRRAALLVAGVIGALFCAAAATCFATVWRRFCLTLPDSERALATKALAALAERDAWLATDPALAGLVTRLCDLRNEHGSTVLDLVAPDGGARALATALAGEFVHGHGLTTLVVSPADGGGNADTGPRADPVTAAGPVAPSARPNTDDVASMTAALANPRSLLPVVMQALGRLRTAYDVVLLAMDDGHGDYASERLAMLADSSLLILRAQITTVAAARSRLVWLRRAGGRTAGFVLIGPRGWLARRLAG